MCSKSWICRSELVTVRKVKRTYVRATERGQEAWMTVSNLKFNTPPRVRSTDANQYDITAATA